MQTNIEIIANFQKQQNEKDQVVDIKEKDKVDNIDKNSLLIDNCLKYFTKVDPANIFS